VHARLSDAAHCMVCASPTLWSCFRLTNIFFTLFSASLIQAVQCFREDPNSFVRAFAAGILRQSSFLMNLIIVATGQETMFQLLQWRSLLKQGVFRPLQNLNAKSSRYINWLNRCAPLERGFLFGMRLVYSNSSMIILLTISLKPFGRRVLRTITIVCADHCDSVLVLGATHARSWRVLLLDGQQGAYP